MKILLIGHRGMLGTALFERFRNSSDIVGVDRAELDITDHDAVGGIISRVNPRIVINAAAYTNVDGAETNPELAYAVNGDACGNLAHFCSAHRARLIHFSTDYVFDGILEGGYDEDNTLNLKPLNVYGVSKLVGERLIARETENFAIVRLSWLFGPGGKNFVDTMLGLGRGRGKGPVQVVNDQFGKPTFTLDVADALERVFDDFSRGIFHLPNEGTTNWFEFAREIFKSAGIDVTVEPVSSVAFPRPAVRPKYSVLNNTKSVRMRPWTGALKDYLTDSS